MFAPEIVIKNAVIESSVKRRQVLNPHIDSEQEGSFVSESYGFYKVTVNFSVIDQYNDSGLGSWIENQDVRKYIKFKINYFTSSTYVVRTTVSLIDFLGEVDIKNYLVIDSTGGRRYEYPISHTILDIPVTIERLPISIQAYFDLKQYVQDQGFSNFYINNEYSDAKYLTIIEAGEIVNSPDIINNVIVEDIEKLQINLSFVDSFEKDIASIIQSNAISNKDISSYVTDLFISKNENNTHSFLFGIDKNKIIQTKTQLGNYASEAYSDPEVASIIDTNLLVKNIYITKKQVKKIESFNKLYSMNDKYINYDNNQTVLFMLDDSNKSIISNNSSYDFYSFTDQTINNDNSIFQYTLTIQIQDSLKQYLVDLYNNLLNNIKQLEEYYNQISIPFRNLKSLKILNPHIDEESYESTNNSESFGYYDIKTNTFKNNAESLIPSNIDDIISNFVTLYSFMFSINKQSIELLDKPSLKLALKNSLSVSLSSLYLIKKTIEIFKSFALTVEKVLNIKIFDSSPENQGERSIKIGSNGTEIIDLVYTFENIVNNTYYNNFNHNKILIVNPLQNTNNFPTIITSNLSMLNRDGELLNYYSPIDTQDIHKLFGSSTTINSAIGIDTKESRLLISYINNLMDYLEEKDLNISINNVDEKYNKIGFKSTLNNLNYESLIGGLLSKHGVEIISFKEDRKPEKFNGSIGVNKTLLDPLNYTTITPRDYPRINRLSGTFEVNDENNDQSVTRLLNYTLSQINSSNNVAFAKIDNQFTDGLINKYIPKYTIEYLDGFRFNIKNYIWKNFNSDTFSSFPLQSSLLCRLVPVYEDKTLELKNVIDKLQIPYKYFILIKNTNDYNSNVAEFTAPLTTQFNETIGNIISTNIRNNTNINLPKRLIKRNLNQQKLRTK